MHLLAQPPSACSRSGALSSDAVGAQSLVDAIAMSQPSVGRSAGARPLIVDADASPTDAESSCNIRLPAGRACVGTGPLASAMFPDCGMHSRIPRFPAEVTSKGFELD